MKKNTAILLMHCDDKQGIVSLVTGFLNNYQGNVVSLEQHVDSNLDHFFMRVEWELEGFGLDRGALEKVFSQEVAEKLNMEFKIYYSDDTPRMAIFVSKLSHCLFDLLAHYKSGEWDVQIPLIISNHPNLEHVAKSFEIPFYCIPLNQEGKDAAEAKQLKLLKENRIDFLVLARYMQVLTPNFLKEYKNRVINIHHSFLPAFAGAKPYHHAYERGVKIIGATSHYVTEDLDAGPIIEQGIIRVNHKNAIDDLVRRGKEVEKTVLSRAVYNHLQRKALIFNNRTIVFE